MRRSLRAGSPSPAAQADWGKALRESNERTNRENHRRSLTNKIEELRKEEEGTEGDGRGKAP